VLGVVKIRVLGVVKIRVLGAGKIRVFGVLEFRISVCFGSVFSQYLDAFNQRFELVFMKPVLRAGAYFIPTFYLCEIGCLSVHLSFLKEE